MAKQCGEHPFTGKLGGAIGYKVNGVSLERENGSKTGKSFRRDPKRKRTMEYARMFAQASQAVKLIYRAIPKDQRLHGVYGKLSGIAFSMLRNGQAVEEVKAALTKQYVEDKEPLVVKQEEKSNTDTGTAGTKALTSDSLASPLPAGPASVRDVAEKTEWDRSHQWETVHIPQRYVITTITRPYFCSTVS